MLWRLRKPRKSLEKLFGVCGSPASASENFLVFAGAPQVPRRTFGRLRESRKSLGELFGVCGSPASPTKNFLAFAGVPQVPRKTFWPLRESRKSLEKLFGLCGSPASASGNFLVFAGIPQAKKKRFGICGTPASIYKVGGLQDGERKYALEPSMPKLSVGIFANAFRRASNVLKSAIHIHYIISRRMKVKNYMWLALAVCLPGLVVSCG